MCPMPARDGCSEANACSLGWSVRCPEGGGNGDAWWWVWGSSCGFPPPQEATASRRSRSVAAATPRAASAPSVTLLDNASARLVPAPARTGPEARLRRAPGLPCRPAFGSVPAPLSSRGPSPPHCSRPRGKSGSIRWELGPRPGCSRGPPRTPRNGWEDWPRRLPAVQKTHPGSAPPPFGPSCRPRWKASPAASAGPTTSI